MSNKRKKDSSKDASKSPRSSLSYMLCLMLNSIPTTFGNQPQRAQMLFYNYYYQSSPPMETATSTISSWKSGIRQLDENITDFYQTHATEFRKNFREKVFPVFDNPTNIANQFCSIMKQSFDTNGSAHYPDELSKPLSQDPADFSPDECSDFLSSSLLYFMQHQNFVFKDFASKALTPAPPPDYIQGCNVPAPCPNFCGREDEIKQIFSMLQDHGYGFITGCSGIGKSECSRGFALTYSQKELKYKHTIEVSFQGSLRNTIIHMPFSCDAEINQLYDTRRAQLISSLGEKPDALQLLQEQLMKLETEHSEALYQAHDQQLSSLSPETLLIIQGMDIRSDQDPLIHHVVDYPCHVLITTQYSYSNFPHLELSEIQNTDTLVELASKYYNGAELCKEEITEIIHALHGHTLLVELSARLLGTRALAPQELLKKLHEHTSNMKIYEPIIITKDHMDVRDTFQGFICTLFPFFKLSQAEQYILTNLALIPSSGIQLEDFKRWLHLSPEYLYLETNTPRDYIQAISLLTEKGLIRNSDGVLSMHGIIREVVLTEDDVAPSIVRCRTMLSSLFRICMLFRKNIPNIETVFLTLMNTVFYAKKDDSKFYTNLLMYAYLSAVSHDYKPAIHVLSEELPAYLQPTGDSLDYVHNAFLHYMNAYTAEQQNDMKSAAAEYQSFNDVIFAMPLDISVSSIALPTCWLISYMAVTAVCRFVRESSLQDVINMGNGILDGLMYFFTPKGLKELVSIMTQILAKIFHTAVLIMCGKPTNITFGDIARIVNP